MVTHKSIQTEEDDLEVVVSLLRYCFKKLIRILDNDYASGNIVTSEQIKHIQAIGRKIADLRSDCNTYSQGGEFVCVCDYVRLFKAHRECTHNRDNKIIFYSYSYQLLVIS